LDIFDGIVTHGRFISVQGALRKSQTDVIDQARQIELQAARLFQFHRSQGGPGSQQKCRKKPMKPLREAEARAAAGTALN